MSAWTFSASNEANLMKIKYGKLIEKQFNKANVLFGRIKKKDDFVGKQIDMPVIQSIGGGVGAGSLPTANENKIGLAQLDSPTKQYAVISIDRETMKAARTDEGAFVRMTKFPVKIAVESFNRNLERQIMKNGLNATANSEALVQGNASNSVVSGAGTSGDPYIIQFDNATTYHLSDIESIEIGDLLNVNAESVDLEVTDVVVNSAVPGSINFDVKLVYLGGTSSTRLDALAACCGTAFGATDYLFMQGSKDNEIEGLPAAIETAVGTAYKGINIGRRWQAYRKDASSASLSTDLMNDVVVNVKRQCGESPNLILIGYHQYIKLLNLLEDQKSYNLPARSPKYKGQISFSAIEYMSADGPIPVVPSRFMDDDKVYFLNDSHIELHCRPGGFEWFDEDGTVFLRESTDSYEARYGGYCELFINPHFQGELHTLAV
jgi:hypothetical protein